MILAAEHLSAQHSAIKMLHSRVKLILDYIKAAEQGEQALQLVVCYGTTFFLFHLGFALWAEVFSTITHFVIVILLQFVVYLQLQIGFLTMFSKHF